MASPSLKTQSTLPLIWASQLSSQFLFVALAWFVPSEASGVPIMDIAGFEVGLQHLLALLAFSTVVVSVGGNLWARAIPQVTTWFILRWALAEAAGLLGFVAYFISGDRPVQWFCAGLGILGHLLAYPTPGAIDEAQPPG